MINDNNAVKNTGSDMNVCLLQRLSKKSTNSSCGNDPSITGVFPPVLSEALEAAPRHQLSGFSLHHVIRSPSERRGNVQPKMKVNIFKGFSKGFASVEAVFDNLPTMTLGYIGAI